MGILVLVWAFLFVRIMYVGDNVKGQTNFLQIQVVLCKDSFSNPHHSFQAVSDLLLVYMYIWVRIYIYIYIYVKSVCERERRTAREAQREREREREGIERDKVGEWGEVS